jgi:hypothetical protein
MAGKRSPTSHRTPEQIRASYASYHSKPEQIANRAQRNAARASMEKKHGAAALKGRDVDHRTPIDRGGGNGAGNLRIQSPHLNRGWERKKGKNP